MTPDEERLDKALTSLSEARTALDDPGALPTADVGFDGREYAIDKIDDAMRLLMREKEEQFGLMVARDGVFITRLFEAEEEAIDAIGHAIIAKTEQPDSVVTIVVGRIEP